VSRPLGSHKCIPCHTFIGKIITSTTNWTNVSAPLFIYLEMRIHVYTRTQTRTYAHTNPYLHIHAYMYQNTTSQHSKHVRLNLRAHDHMIYEHTYTQLTVACMSVHISYFSCVRRGRCGRAFCVCVTVGAGARVYCVSFSFTNFERFAHIKQASLTFWVKPELLLELILLYFGSKST